MQSAGTSEAEGHAGCSQALQRAGEARPTARLGVGGQSGSRWMRLVTGPEPWRSLLRGSREAPSNQVAVNLTESFS